VFHLRKESSFPDLATLSEQFIWKVSFQVSRWLRHWFIFLIDIFYKGWKGPSLAGISLLGVFSFGVPLCLAVGLTAYAAVWKAPSHLDGFGVEVDLQIMLVQPGDLKYHALLAKTGDCKQDMLRVLIVGHNYVNDLVNTSGLIESSVHVGNQNWLGQLVGQKFGLGDEILINEVSSGSMASVDDSFMVSIVFK